MRQSAISASRFLEALPSPPQTSAEWSIFSVHLVEPPPHFAGKFSDHVLALQLSGTCRFRREIGGRPIEGWSGPGCVHLIPAHVHAKSDGWDHSGTSRAIVLFMPQAFLSRVIAEDWGSSQGVSKLFRNSSHVIRSWKAFCAALHSKQGTVRHPDSSTRKARVNSWRITLSTRLVTITRSAPREGRVTGRSAKACFGLHRRRTGSADSLTQTCRTRKCQPQAFGTCLLASAWYSTSCIRDEKARGCGAAPSSQRTEAQH